jgi:exodeoxyribonuclease-3
MNIVCFNVNGIRARLHQLDRLFQTLSPAIIGLQETKVIDELFPMDVIQAAGYEAHIFGQKGHYGVAILSRMPVLSVQKGFPGEDASAQRRFIHVSFDAPWGKPLHVLNGYFPQGEGRSHPVKFPAKEKFYADLLEYLNHALDPDDEVVLMGDFNVAPLDRDIGIGEQNAKRWLRTGKSSFLPEERVWYDRLLAWGFEDCFHEHNIAADRHLSWFDYRSRGFDDDPRRGLRIDHILTTPTLGQRIKSTGIDYEIRGMEKPSDHAPVWIHLST